MDKLTDLFREYGVPLPVRLHQINGKTIAAGGGDENRLFLFFIDGTGVSVRFDKRTISSDDTLGEWAWEYAAAAGRAFGKTADDGAKYAAVLREIDRLLDKQKEDLERIEYERLKAKYGG
jgi:hypothetical protein